MTIPMQSIFIFPSVYFLTVDFSSRITVSNDIKITGYLYVLRNKFPNKFLLFYLTVCQDFYLQS